MEAIALDLVKGSIESLLNATAIRIGEEIVLLWGLKADLNSLKKELIEVNGLLLGAESKFGSGLAVAENPVFKGWVKEVAQVAYRAEDVIDEYAYEVLKRRLDLAETAGMKSLLLRLKSKVGLFSSSFSNNNPVVFRFRMAHKVKSLRESIAEISANAKRLGIKLVDVADVAGASRPSRSHHNATSPAERQLQLRRENVEYEGLIGRDRFIDQIKEELRKASNSDKRLTVIGICGMGGRGKTAVSRNIFNASEVKDYLKEQIWICVSYDVKFEKLLKGMLEQLGERSTISDIEAIKKILREKLEGKKFFLVLDDVWDTFETTWEPFRLCLQDISKLTGNTILVTSRNEDVLTKLKTYDASMQSIDDPRIHKLCKLTKEDSLSLFKNRVGDDLSDSTKAQLAWKISDKCEGEPLAIRTVADLLRSRDIHIWEEIEASGIWNEQDEIMPSIKLSFKYLPSVALKKCFVYCAIFEEDEIIEKDRLIQLWMAQGFLRHPDDEMERVGEEYFCVLLNNSLFQDPEFDSLSGNVISCTMHDVVHALARALSSNDVTQQVQHLSLSPYDYRPRSSLEVGDNLRTLFLFYHSCDLENFSNNMTKYLRALSLDVIDTEKVLDSIDKLKHLRYLDIPGIESLPDALVKLYNLQTLRFGSFDENGLVPMFPKGFNQLVNLRHIRLDDNRKIGVPVGLQMLTCLRTLPTIDANADWGGKLSELQSLSKLKGRLKIDDLQHVEVEEAKKVNLGMKNHINELILSWLGGDPFSNDSVENEKMVLEALQPHANLGSLQIVGYNAKELPSWVREMTGYRGSPLRNLVRLDIDSCLELEHLPTSLKNLVSLKALFIFYCENAISFPHHLECLTSLQQLELIHCDKMENITADMAPLVSLRKVNIICCRNMTCLPTGILDLPSLEELSIGGFSSELDVFPFPTMDTNYDILPSICSLNGAQRAGVRKFRSLVALDLDGEGMDNVKNLPNQIKYLCQLRRLGIWGFNSLEALPEWLGNLTSLRVLELCHLRNLKCLPSQAALRHLTKLKMYDCPQLKEACVGESGAEWPKLQQIPDVTFDTLRADWIIEKTVIWQNLEP